MGIEKRIMDIVAENHLDYKLSGDDANPATVKYAHTINCELSFPGGDARGGGVLAFLSVDAKTFKKPDALAKALAALVAARDALAAKGYEATLQEDDLKFGSQFTYLYEFPYKSKDVLAVLQDFYFS